MRVRLCERVCECEVLVFWLAGDLSQSKVNGEVLPHAPSPIAYSIPAARKEGIKSKSNRKEEEKIIYISSSSEGGEGREGGG